MQQGIIVIEILFLCSASREVKAEGNFIMGVAILIWNPAEFPEQSLERGFPSGDVSGVGIGDQGGDGCGGLFVYPCAAVYAS